METECDVIDERLLLCLNCRCSGHLFAECSRERGVSTTSGYLNYLYEVNSQAELLGLSLEHSDICSRCSALEIYQWLQEDLPLQEQADLNKEVYQSNRDIFRPLGPISSFILRIDCSLCRCLLAMIPEAVSGEQVVTLGKRYNEFFWTGERVISSGGSAQNLFAILMPFDSESHSLTAEIKDSLSISKFHPKESYTPLKAREIHHRINYDIIRKWLSTCERFHPISCKRPQPDVLRSIILIDCEARSLVTYSEVTKEYLALSYVWGGVAQNCPNAVSPGISLNEVCPTVEDAIKFTINLGKRYLWVDSLCIDQQDSEHKSQQIGLMGDIYGGAYATIVALSAKSANSELPGVGSHSKRRPQLRCNIGNAELVSIGTTFSNAVAFSDWDERGWTFQEALLSPRCIYLDEMQTFFECNAMNCCETLHEKPQNEHQTNSTRSDVDFSNHVNQISSEIFHEVGFGWYRNPLIYDSSMGPTLFKYIASSYAGRKFTNESDVLDAFEGVLQLLTAKGERCFGALPKACFNQILLWEPSIDDGKRRPEFPTWNWVSWSGRSTPWWPNQEESPFDLTICGFNGECVEAIFESKCLDEVVDGEPFKDPISARKHTHKALDLSALLDHNDKHLLLSISSFSLAFKLNTSEFRSHKDGYVSWIFYKGKLHDVVIEYELYVDGYLYTTRFQDITYDFILISRSIEHHGLVDYYLMAIEENGDCYESRGILKLQIPVQDLWVLEKFGLRRRQILLR